VATLTRVLVTIPPISNVNCSSLRPQAGHFAVAVHVPNGLNR